MDQPQLTQQDEIRLLRGTVQDLLARIRSLEKAVDLVRETMAVQNSNQKAMTEWILVLKERVFGA